MLKFIPLFLLFISPLPSFGSLNANYRVLPGSLHKKGNVVITVLEDPAHYKVQMNYDVKKKDLVPVPSKLLKGKTVMEFPEAFKTESGYKTLESKKTMDIPKAQLKFVKRGAHGALSDAYFLEVHPVNKKSKIDIVYHPSLPSVGWAKIRITFISPFPVLNGYELEAELRP